MLVRLLFLLMRKKKKEFLLAFQQHYTAQKSSQKHLKILFIFQNNRSKFKLFVFCAF